MKSKRKRGLVKYSLLMLILASWRLNDFSIEENTQPQSESIVSDSPTTSNSDLPFCTEAQLGVVLQQLPPELCMKFENRPWIGGGVCSFSFASRCPNANWLTNFYTARVNGAVRQQDTFTAVVVGCNKGMDAIDILRMGSGNSTYDKKSWRKALLGESVEFVEGSCNQENSPQFQIPIKPMNRNSFTAFPESLLHCIEPLPANSRRLITAAQDLQIDEAFRVHAVAISDHDGFVYFPTDAKVGSERTGIDSCTPRQRRRNMCEPVPVVSLDTFWGNTSPKPTQRINILSIDAEGYDALVLKGSSTTLQKVDYLEFEYGWKGAWQNISLKSTIDSLKDKGFYCYFAGSFGNLWRITDCWLEHYSAKHWSNVACVNSREQELLHAMETSFQSTLGARENIRYHDRSTAKTDGRVHG